MRNFTVYDKEGKILRTGRCRNVDFLRQAHEGEFIIRDVANAATQKVEFDDFDENGQPIDPRIVDKTPEEIERDNPPLPEVVELPKGKRLASVTNEQWQNVLKRLDKLDKKFIERK